jgi:hypothetical protein
MLPWGMSAQATGADRSRRASCRVSLLTGQTSKGGSCLEGGSTSGTDFIETALLKSSTSAPQVENDRQAVGKGDELDMPRVEERLQRLSEEGDEPQQMCERWSKRSAFWERWCEFAVVVSRLNQLEAEAPTGNGEESTEEINELWRKRAELATEIVDAAVATVEEAIFKVTVTASLLSEGEIRVVLTPQCLVDCDRALAADGDGEQCVKTLEPDLWTACLRVREQIAEADEDAETLGLTWWRDLQNLVGEIAGYEAMTRAGLRAKGQVFQDLFDFASLMDGLSGLQMSYVRDFGNLAYRRLREGLAADASGGLLTGLNSYAPARSLRAPVRQPPGRVAGSSR